MTALKNKILSTVSGIALLIGSTAACAQIMERPRLENYSSYKHFLSDMAVYKKQQEDAAKKPATAPSTAVTATAPVSAPVATPRPVQVQAPVAAPSRIAAPIPVETFIAETIAAPEPEIDTPSIKVETAPTVVAAPVMVSSDTTPPVSNDVPPAAIMAILDPNNEDAPPPLVINGPEDLDNAVELAKNFPHPRYTNDKRYNRSTSKSFPLPQLASSDLQVSSVAESVPAVPLTSTGVNKDVMKNKAEEQASEEEMGKMKVAGEDTDKNELRRRSIEDMTLAHDHKGVQIHRYKEMTYLPTISGRSGGVDDVYIGRTATIMVRN